MFVIYQIENLDTNKSYIGVTQNLPRRMSVHRCKGTRPVQGRYSVRILAQTYSKIEANRLEDFYIEKKNALYPSGYNLRAGGLDGYTHSASTRNKIRVRAEGRVRKKP